jgi:hypothetical protein
MDPLSYFASTVIFIGTFHLISVTVDAISKHKHASAVQAAEARSDWYCFFSLSSLYGKSNIESKNTDQPDLHQTELIEEHKRRQEAHRPRLQIS